MNQEDILAKFYVLARDVERVRYCTLAPIWYDMASNPIWDETAQEWIENPFATLAEMIRLQREHEGQVSAKAVMERLEALEAKIDAMRQDPQAEAQAHAQGMTRFSKLLRTSRAKVKSRADGLQWALDAAKAAFPDCTMVLRPRHSGLGMDLLIADDRNPQKPRTHQITVLGELECLADLTDSRRQEVLACIQSAAKAAP